MNIKQISKVAFLTCLTFGAFTALKAQESDFKESKTQVQGDIYGQVRVLGDIDGDGKKDLVFGATDGKIHIYSSGTGKEIVRPPYWPKQTGGPIMTSVEVVQGEKGTEIIAASMDGKVYCIDSMSKTKWVAPVGGKNGKIESPDLNVGEKIYVGASNGNVASINRKTGEIEWIAQNPDGITGNVEAIELSSKDTAVICRDKGNKVIVLGENGTPRQTWPKSLGEKNGEWGFDASAADFDGDGNKEIYTTTKNGKMIIWNSDGKVVDKLSVGKGSHGAPIVADIDGDGKNEILVAGYKDSITVYDSKGNPKKGWPFVIQDQSVYSRPVVMDIDGDGKLDIIYTAINPNGKEDRSGFVMALGLDGKPLSGYPKYVGRVTAAPTFADLNGNGKLEMIVPGGIGYTGKQINIFPTEARSRIRFVVFDQETKYK